MASTDITHYCIGIDLGTSNCALAWVKRGDASSETSVLEIAQHEAMDRLVRSSTLPSFLYFPHEGEGREDQALITGLMARQRLGELPGRVIHAAKSWLCHSNVDRRAKLLPWTSPEVPDAQKLSPIEASAAYLAYLRESWHEAFGNNPTLRLEDQDVVITVPASFDQVAQQLTLEAAKQAGFPQSVRLLEEPQAAFYHWLNTHGRDSLERDLPALSQTPQRILVCDIGGGTTDFSLFEVRAAEEAGSLPAIERLSVSEHLLLGGDNIDLAIAHLLATELYPGEEPGLATLSQLVAEGRRLKEAALQAEPPESAHVSIAAQGSSLFASTRSTEVSLERVRKLVIDGFFPDCESSDQPKRGGAGLQEMGLPYAADTAITRHLASFLQGKSVDAILFNGGTLIPQRLQERLQAIITAWQDKVPVLLEAQQLDLAVARGAAYASWLEYRKPKKKRRGKKRSGGHPTIESAVPQTIYLEIAGKDEAQSTQHICILPSGTPYGETLDIIVPDLQLRVNESVAFEAWSSNRECDPLGSLRPKRSEPHHSLPQLESRISMPESAQNQTAESIPVHLQAVVHETGLLQICCIYQIRFGKVERWELSFNLRGETDSADGSASVQILEPGVAPERIRAAQLLLEQIFKASHSQRPDPGEAQGLLKRLEKELGLSKAEWNPVLLRRLWSPLADGIARRSKSIDHETAWLIAAGFSLRPGYGTSGDAGRIEELLKLQALGVAHPQSKQVREQLYILWRRTAGGLSAQTQEALLDEHYKLILEDSTQAMEAVRMAGSFEWLPKARKEKLLEHCLEAALRRAGQGKYCEHHLWTLGRLLSRIPLYATEDRLLPPAAVEKAFEALSALDWNDKQLGFCNQLFAQAARRTGRRELDLSEPAREAILAKMRASQASDSQLRLLEAVVEVEAADLNTLFGERLPPGLLQASH